MMTLYVIRSQRQCPPPGGHVNIAMVYQTQEHVLISCAARKHALISQIGAYLIATPTFFLVL